MKVKLSMFLRKIYVITVQQNNTKLFLDFFNADYKQFSLWLKRVDWFGLLFLYNNVEDMWKKLWTSLVLDVHYYLSYLKCRKNLTHNILNIFKDS